MRGSRSNLSLFSERQNLTDDAPTHLHHTNWPRGASHLGGLTGREEKEEVFPATCKGERGLVFRSLRRGVSVCWRKAEAEEMEVEKVASQKRKNRKAMCGEGLTL